MFAYEGVDSLELSNIWYPETSLNRVMPDRLPSICFVAPHAFPLLAGDERTEVIGGAELQQVIVAKGLAERGYSVSMICLDFGQQDQVEIDGITVFRAFKPDEGIPVLRFLWPRLTSIWASMRRADTDIYYQRSASMLTGVVAVFCQRHGKKSIFAGAGNPNFERNTSRIQYRRDRWIYEYGLRHVDRILVQNSEQAMLCSKNFGRDSIFVASCFHAAVRQFQEGSRQILWVSTIRILKRPELFLELAAALPKYRFKMVGGAGSGADEKRLFESVRARAQQLDNLDFLGFVPYSRINEHFDSASLFVNTSTSEGFPNTFLQAWAREVPTVSFVDCGARANGHPVGRTVCSMEEMIDSIVSLMSNDTDRFTEGRRGREYVEQNHSLARVLDTYENVFNSLTSK